MRVLPEAQPRAERAECELSANGKEQCGCKLPIDA